jgi:hypothetical protein
MGMRMGDPDQLRVERGSFLVVALVLLIACVGMAVAVHQASGAFGAVRDKAEVRECTITHDPMTGQAVSSGC